MIWASVIIPTYNRADTLLDCLEALTHQNASPDSFEVVVVVDGSTDATLDRLAAFQPPYQLQVIKQFNSGQPAALNRGAQLARGEILIFIDDDITASPQLVEEHLKLHKDHEHAVGIGRLSLTLSPTADWYTHRFFAEWEAHYDQMDRGAKEPTFMDCFGGNMSVSRADFLAVAGNDARLRRAYDTDLAYRLARLGCTFIYLPRAVGSQRQIKGYRDLTADAEKSGQACVQLAAKYPELQSQLLGAFSEQRISIAAPLKGLLALNPSPNMLEQIRRLSGRRTENQLSYQIIARYCFWRAVRKALPDRKNWQALTRGVPILMYHAFSAQGEPHGRFVMPIQKFKQQMTWLKRAGYQVIGLQDYINCRLQNRLPPKRAVIITIDDGYADSWNLACPVLRQYDFPATLFAVSQSVGKKNTWAEQDGLADRLMLTWPALRELQANGIDIGAHTRTHPILPEIPPNRALEEITGSLQELEQGLGKPIHLFSYPYGKHNPQIQALVEQAGFQAACSTDEGKNSLATSLYRLHRVEIRGSDNLLQFAMAVHFGLDQISIKRQLQNSLNNWRKASG